MSEVQEKRQFKRSKQRDKILDILQNTDSHPTADWIHKQVKSEFSTLSLGTVYRNLKILKEQGKIYEVNFGNGFNRFDANMKPHHHLICDKCGRIMDIEIPMAEEIYKQVTERTGFVIDSHRVEFHGLCSECKKVVS